MSTRACRVRSYNTGRLLVALVVCALLATVSQLATAQNEPSREPILRIETGCTPALSIKSGWMPGAVFW